MSKQYTIEAVDYGSGDLVLQIRDDKGDLQWFREIDFDTVLEGPTQQSWDYSTANALLNTANKAIDEYNEYIQRKPSTYYSRIYK